ncbi:hypothetical protein [Hymenobacter aquaticus]|uniref:hypothetical protein n=1 Tax=Hymenobacter aquaticus TaxID=1867101 RepID=UPI001AEC33CB|nr:hypothetical protein [Hymenobacter aquaticus]
MKSILNTVLPAMALLALGGCATTSGLTSTEGDGVYYSSKDRTTYNAPARSTASAPDNSPQDNTSSDAETNPDYASSGSGRSSAQGGSSEYYDDDYSYSARIRRFHQPVYRSFGYGYYDPFYSDPFWYGGGVYSYGYSPYSWGPGYGYYDPFYGPYYGGSAVIINIGIGRPYYNPWRYGYGGYGYGYGGYGYGGGYGLGYYDGYRNGLYRNSNYGYGGTVRNVRYGPRSGRSVEATTASGRTTTDAGSGRGRGREGGVAAPVDGVTSTGNATGTSTATPSWNGRGRQAQPQAAGGVTETPVSTTPNVRSGRSRSAIFEDTRGRVVEGGGTREQGMEQPQVTQGNTRRWRTVENTGEQGVSTPSAPNYEQRRRFGNMNQGSQNDGQNSGGQAVEQPVRRQRVYNSPQQPQRTYEAPQRSYEAPSRSYSEPSRGSSSPSMGGGNSGGGGGRSSGRGRGE